MAKGMKRALTTKQQDAIVALITEPTLAKASAVCGVPGRTMYNWLEDELFAEAYRQARRQAFTQAVAMAQRYAPVAINGLVRVIADPAAPYTAKVAACIGILRFSRDSMELDDLAARVQKLEASMSGGAPVDTTAWAIDGGAGADPAADPGNAPDHTDVRADEAPGSGNIVGDGDISG
jgi:hypothetical protein